MKLSIIPRPLEEIIKDDGSFFIIDNTVQVTKNYLNITNDLNDFINKAFGYTLSTSDDASIELVLDDNINLGEEGYFLDVSIDSIIIKASNERGLFYGIQTLKQLITQFIDNQGASIPLISIKDRPLYEYRGYMLDSCRHFFRVEDIVKVIDIIALHKINVFHWHLTEDQGWRIEIDKYPKLTTIGGRRKETLGDNKLHGGYYSKSEIKKIIEYCSSKYIDVIPEIDLPGHSMAAAAAYNYLTCKGEPIEVATSFGIKLDIFCAGKDTTYQFLFDVLDEIVDLFPSQFIHLGGDEAPKIRWSECPLCQQAIKDNNLQDEEQLQGYFLNRLVVYLKSKGKRVICWNESIYSGILDQSVICQYWSDGKKPLRVVKEMNRGRQTIISRFTPYYLDYPYAMHSLKKAYKFRPELKGLESNEMIKGIEAPLWTEYVSQLDEIEYQSFPRLGAIAETAWTDRSLRDYGDFMSRLDNYYRLLDVYGVAYAGFKDVNPGLFKSIVMTSRFVRRMISKESIRAIRYSIKASKALHKKRKE